MCANCPTSIFRKYVSWTKSGPAKAGPAGPLATAMGWLVVGLLVGWLVGWLVGYLQIEGIDYTDIQAGKRNAERDLQTKETLWINTPSTKHTSISTTSQPTPYSKANEETNKIQHDTTHTRSHLYKYHPQNINSFPATSETPTITNAPNPSYR